MNLYKQNNNIVDSTGSIIPRFKSRPLSIKIAAILLAGTTMSSIANNSTYAYEITQVQDNKDTAEVVEKEDTDKENAKAEKDSDIVETIRVSGIRQSKLSALDRKKNAGTMMDSLVAEDIGEFPDKNVAEALQRISGIQLSRDMGEGASVSVRGVESALVRVEVNGVTAMGTGGSRSVDFRDMASELVKSIDVYKGSEARLDEGGVGGTIQINTRKPNEFDENFFSVNAESQYNTLIDEYMPKFNFTGVYKVSDDLGFLINLTGSDQHQMFHALRNSSWAKYHDIDGSPDKTAVDLAWADYSTQAQCLETVDGTSTGAYLLGSSDRTACLAQWAEFSPTTPRYSIWGREEQRLSANIEFQYKINDDLSIDASYTDSSRNKVATDRNFQVEVGRSFNTDTALLDEYNNVVYLETNGVNEFGTLVGANVRNRTLNFDWDQERTVGRIGFDYNKDALKIKGYIARSTTFEDIDQRDTQTLQNNVGGITITQANGLPYINFDNAYVINPDDADDIYQTFNVNDAKMYTSLDRFKYAPSQSEASENIAKVDLTYVPDSDLFTMIYTGFRATDQRFANNAWDYNIFRNVGVAYNDGQDVWTIDDHLYVLEDNRFATDMFMRDYNVGIPVMSSYMAVDTEKYLAALLERNGFTTARSARDNLSPLTSRYNINVKTQSAYVQTDFETYFGDMRLKGNFGVRVAKTETESEGYSRIRVLVEPRDPETGEILLGDNGEFLDGVEDQNDPRWFEGRDTISEDFIDVLPSFNVILEAFEGFEIYAGAAKVMSRPRITDLNINASCTLHDYTKAQQQDYANTCTAGNPDLDPYRANQYEVAVTYYPDEVSIISAAYFVKDITSYIFGAVKQEDVDFFNDGRLWDVTQQTNQTGIKTKGIEAQASTFFGFLPAPFNNMGGKINYTYITAENVNDFNPLTGERMPLRGQSKNSYNLEAFYEDEFWSIKLTYNYRDSYYRGISNGNPVFIDDAGYLDGKITYRYNENLKLYVDGRNLAREVQKDHAGPGRVNSLEWSGRVFAAGFTYKF